MGFFSWNCNRCEKSLLNEFSVDKINEWMKDVVVILPDGTILKGEYDGYGRVDGIDIFSHIGYGSDPCCYHRACWELDGCPAEFDPSEHAIDQGYFFDPFEDGYNIPDPRR